MNIQFSKMHGLGNDFMVIDNVTQNIYLSKDAICRLADRNMGVGFDQLLMIEPPYNPELDFHYRIFNADGSYEYKFRVLNSENGVTSKIFDGDYSVKIFKVVYLNQESLI